MMWIQQSQNQATADNARRSRSEIIRLFQWIGRRWRHRRSGRRRVRELIESSDLPPSVQAVVIDVVERTRLWAGERLDVARELIAHFRDGLEAGRSAEALRDEFGDGRQSARLIRRAKKRNRPLWWQASRRVGQGVAVLVALYLLLAVRFFTGEPSVTTDYLAQVTAPARAADPDERAWPVYREAYVELRDVIVLFREAEAVVDAHNKRRQAEAMLKERRDVIERLHNASRLPSLGYDPSRGPTAADRDALSLSPHDDVPQTLHGSLYHVRLPHIAVVRRLSQMLWRDGKLAAADGDGTRAFDNVRAIIDMAAQTREIPLIVMDLVSLAMYAKGCDLTGEVLAETPTLWSDADLQRIAHKLTAFGGDGRMQLRLDGERAFMADLLQRQFTDDGQGGGRLTPEGIQVILALANEQADAPLLKLLGPALMLISHDRREIESYTARQYDRVEAHIRQPLWELDASEVEQEVKELHDSLYDRIRYAMLIEWMPAVSRASASAEATIQRRDATLTAIALELYRRRNGRWPDDLDALTPDLLPEVPRDRYDGGPIKYLLRDGEPVLYSVGADRVDQGGRAPMRGGRPRVHVAARWIPPERVEAGDAPRGDWILWSRAELVGVASEVGPSSP